MDQFQRYLANERAKEAALTRAATGAGAAGLAASTLAGFNWPGLAARSTPNLMGPLGVLAGTAMPTTMGDQEQDPRYRQQIQDQARTNFQDRGFQQPTQPNAGGDMSSIAQLLQSLMGR